MAREISHGEIYWSRLSYIRPVLTHGSGPVPVQYRSTPGPLRVRVQTVSSPSRGCAGQTNGTYLHWRTRMNQAMTHLDQSPGLSMSPRTGNLQSRSPCASGQNVDSNPHCLGRVLQIFSSERRCVCVRQNERHPSASVHRDRFFEWNRAKDSPDVYETVSERSAVVNTLVVVLWRLAAG